MTLEERMLALAHELADSRERLTRLEEHRKIDVSAMESLAGKIDELEEKLTNIANNFLQLSTNVTTIRVDMQELYRELSRFSMKLATLEERSIQHEKINAERYENIKEQITSVNENVSKIANSVERPNANQPWYKDTKNFKEIAAAIVLIITMLLTSINSAKIESLPKSDSVDIKRHN